MYGLPIEKHDWFLSRVSLEWYPDELNPKSLYRGYKPMTWRRPKKMKMSCSAAQSTSQDKRILLSNGSFLFYLNKSLPSPPAAVLDETSMHGRVLEYQSPGVKSQRRAKTKDVKG